MGQAKRRGTYEERREQAISRKSAALRASLAKRIEESRAAPQEEPPVRRSRHRMMPALLIAAALGGFHH